MSVPLLPKRLFHSRSLQGLLLLLAALALGACGGNGGSATTDATGTGSVGIVLTDAPSDDFQAINMTVQEVLLLSSDGSAPVSVFSGEQTVDLLSLRDHAELFALGDVPAGHYEKIRLILKQPDGLELVTRDGVSHYPNLTGNGKLDLNPRGGFSVADGQMLYLQIDVDADKSIHVHQTGHGGYKFRPVVFVDVIGDQFSGKLVRRTGYVGALADDASRFTLCDMPQTFSDDPDASKAEDGDEADGEVNDDHSTGYDDDEDDDRICLRVVTADAKLFGADGLPLALADLTADERVTAIGFLHRALTDARYEDDGDDDDYAERATLYAEVIEVLSEVGGFETVPGSVVSEPADASDSFTLKLADDSELSIALQDGTKVFARDGTPLDFTAILTGSVASVDGVRVDQGTTDERLLASLIVIDTAAPATAEKLIGSINTTDADSRTFVMTTTDSDVSVKLTADSLILQLGDYADGSRSASVDFASLAMGQSVEIYGQSDALGYFVAKLVLITQ